MYLYIDRSRQLRRYELHQTLQLVRKALKGNSQGAPVTKVFEGLGDIAKVDELIRMLGIKE